MFSRTRILGCLSMAALLLVAADARARGFVPEPTMLRPEPNNGRGAKPFRPELRNSRDNRPASPLRLVKAPEVPPRPEAKRPGLIRRTAAKAGDWIRLARERSGPAHAGTPSKQPLRTRLDKIAHLLDAYDGSSHKNLVRGRHVLRQLRGRVGQGMLSMRRFAAALMPPRMRTAARRVGARATKLRNMVVPPVSRAFAKLQMRFLREAAMSQLGPGQVSKPLSAASTRSGEDLAVLRRGSAEPGVDGNSRGVLARLKTIQAYLTQRLHVLNKRSINNSATAGQFVVAMDNINRDLHQVHDAIGVLERYDGVALAANDSSYDLTAANDDNYNVAANGPVASREPAAAARRRPALSRARDGWGAAAVVSNNALRRAPAPQDQALPALAVGLGLPRASGF